ncbi:MAG: RNA polymerase sigma factor [Polyangiales bacterium]
MRSREVPERARRETVTDDVVARLRAGEAAAFGVVYETYRARVYAFLLRLSGDAHTASDLAQETWLRLAASAMRLTPETDVGAWLFTVARNLHRSQRRWTLLDRDRLAALGLMAPRAAASPLDEAARDQLTRKLEHALAALPVRLREVVLLSTVEGFSAPEVARMLQLAPAAVRQRLSRGRALLRAALDHDAPGGDDA